jgi:SAM-dependent methyltransferase
MKKLYNPYLKISACQNYIEYSKSILDLTLHQRDMLNVLDNWKQDVSYFSLLDIGCGLGNIVNNDVIKRFKNYTGVEPSEEFFKYANKYNKNDGVNFYNCSVEDLPFEDNSFDFMISNETWYYIKDINRAAEECGRVLKEKSPVLIYTRNPNNMLSWPQIDKLINKTKEDIEVHSVINTSFGECDIGEHFLSRISMDDLIKSFERVDIKIVLVNYHKFNKVILDTSVSIQGEKND